MISIQLEECSILQPQVPDAMYLIRCTPVAVDRSFESYIQNTRKTWTRVTNAVEVTCVFFHSVTFNVVFRVMSVIGEQYETRCVTRRCNHRLLQFDGHLEGSANRYGFWVRWDAKVEVQVMFERDQWDIDLFRLGSLFESYVFYGFTSVDNLRIWASIRFDEGPDESRSCVNIEICKNSNACIGLISSFYTFL